LEEEEVKIRQSLLKHAVLQQGWQLVSDFQRMVHKRQADQFTHLLQACQASHLPEFVNLASGMKKDQEAIQTALSSKWSNGQTEGQVNRLKLLKRQMYGRASFDLLAARFLQPPELSTKFAEDPDSWVHYIITTLADWLLHCSILAFDERAGGNSYNQFVRELFSSPLG